jgi:integrase
MSLFQRNRVWWIDFRHKGKRIRKSTGTEIKEDAEEYYDKIKYEYWRIAKLGEKPRRSWKETVVKWCQENEQKKSLSSDLTRLRLLHNWLDGMFLDQIDKELVDKIKYERAAQPKRSNGSKGELVSNAEVNRLLALLRSILNAAHKQWEWIDAVPTVKLLKENKRRIRWITKEEAKILLTNLPDYLRDIAIFSLATGLREQNVLGITWEQIDTERHVAWVYEDETKNGQSLAVPLNSNAMNVLKRNMGNHSKYPFTYRNNRIQRANNKAWKQGLEKSNIDDFRWHDLRHTWASWHIQNGTPLHVLQELGGWESVDMVRRYAHLSPANLSMAAANNLIVPE